jgi:DNA polymerase-3 subunit delta'
LSVWDGFVGAERVGRQLANAAEHPSGPYLFVGPPGAGYRHAARLFAAAVICEDACGQCNTCSRVMRAIHPDIAVFAPEGYTYPVEELRGAVVAAAQSPMEASHRVFILEEADRIAERSQNALLKALEEPAPSIVWVLLAETLEPFLPTILSRCQRIDFPPLGESAVLQALQQRFQLEEGEAARIVRASRGDLDAAAKLVEEPYAAMVRTKAIETAALSGATVSRLLEVVDQIVATAGAARTAAESKQDLGDLAQLTGRGAASLQKRMASVHKRTLRRVETEVYVDFLTWLGAAFRDLAAASAGAGSEALVSAELHGKAAHRPTRFWVQMIDRCLEGQLALRSNANANLVLESTLLYLI